MMEEVDDLIGDQGICPDEACENEEAAELSLDSDSNVDEASEEDVDDVDASSEEPRSMFNPPLYYQRYNIVQEIITSHQKEGMDIQKMLDVGCAECSFLQHAKQLPFLTEMYGLDIDKDLVVRKSATLKPLVTDYICKRDNDLHMRVLAGSIADRDSKTKQIDVVTGIEVIEHLHPPILDAMVETVFSYIRPRLVILTTPNSEYNVLFPNFSGTRHWDHKFEWTRQEFQDWADGVSSKHGYKVSYSGVGDPPVDQEHLGHCSQLAVFVRSADSQDTQLEHNTEYEEVFSAVYPGHNISEYEKIKNEIIYTVNRFSTRYVAENDVEDLRLTHLPISEILVDNRRVKDEFDVDTLADRLEEFEYTLSDDRQYLVIDMEEPESSDYDDDWAGGDGDGVWLADDQMDNPNNDDGYLSDGATMEEDWG